MSPRRCFLMLAMMFCLQAFAWLWGECFAQTFQDRTTQFLAGAGIPDGWPIGYPGGWGDYNNDGFPDHTSNGHVLRNNTGTSFTVVSQPIGNSIWGDHNNDGRLDRFSYDSFLLVKQNSSGEFVGYSSGIPLPDGTTSNDVLWQAEHLSWGATWSDLNNDGYLDLYVGGFEGPGVYYPDFIFAYDATNNEFNITWQDTSPPLYRPARGVTAADFDRDGDQDIYVSNYRLEPNRLWLNDGTGTMTDVAASYGVSGGAHTIGSAWGDIDNDGWLDLFVGNFSHPGQESARFFRNPGSGGGSFQLMKTFDGADWVESYASPALGDYDNDGDVDLYFTTVYAGDHPRLYRNDGAWNFTDVTAAAGLGGLDETYQASWADIDNDGDLDLSTDSKYFINTQSNANHWLEIKLIGDGDKANTSAIGAQVRVYANGQTLTRQVEGGTGQGNQNDLTLHFGLGSHNSPVALDILWPDGSTQSTNNVPIDRLVAFDMMPDVEIPVEKTMPGTTVQPVLWLDAGAGITASGGLVSLWEDRSTGGAGDHDAVQPDANRRPLLVADAVNGQPAIRFDPSATTGNFDWMTIPDHDDLDIGDAAGVGATLFVVFVGVDWTQRFLLDKRAASGSDDWGVWSLPDGDGVLRWRNGNDPDDQLDVPAPSLDAFHLLTCDLDQPTPGSGSKRVWVDSVPAGSNTYVSPNATNSGPLNIGKHGSLPDDFTFIGDVAEIVLFNSVLNDADRDVVTAYLNTKYVGLPVEKIMPGTTVQPVLWLDAGAGVTASGGLVSLWEDRSTGGAGDHDAVQAVGSRQPTLVPGAVNGEPAIRFTPGSLPDSDWMEIADHDDLDIGQGAGIGFTAFIVFSAPDFVGQRHLLEKREGTDDWGFWLLDGNLRWRTENTANLDTPAPSADAFHIWASDLDQTGASSGTKRSWIDGVMGNTSPQDYTTKEGTNAAPMYIGRHGAAGLEDLFTFSGDLAEVIFFDSVLNDADRDTVHDYLNTRYFMPPGVRRTMLVLR